MTSARCSTFVGPDRCELHAGHGGAHHTMWGTVRMTWDGGEEWSHELHTGAVLAETPNVGVDGGGHQIEAQIGSQGVTDESVSDG